MQLFVTLQDLAKMKVIFAGFSKTGTKTMQAALTEFGYDVYDYMEQYTYLGKEWAKIMSEGGTTARQRICG